MAYLDNSTEVTIDATLTRKGREMLSEGRSLDIVKFALADDEIDYSLYDPAHPKGSAYYDSAILALPILEASVDETQMLRYKLMTMPRGTDLIPTIRVNTDLLNKFIIYAGDGVDFVEPTDVTITAVSGDLNTTFTIILADDDAGNLTGATQETRPAGSEVRSTIFHITGKEFRFTPNGRLVRSVSTTLTIVGDQTGASTTMPVVITYVRGV
jgi:hypothetical protein